MSSRRSLDEEYEAILAFLKHLEDDKKTLGITTVFPPRGPTRKGATVATTTARKTPTKAALNVQWDDVEKLLALGVDRMLFHGPPGTGKTYAAIKVGKIKPEHVYNVYLGEETPAYDLIGHDVVVDGSMIWRDGPAISAWRTGGRLILNEIDQASGDALDALTAILDDPETAGYVLPTGEYVKPKAGFQCVATMNGDPKLLPEKLLDRLTVRVAVEDPHPAAIAALPEAVGKLAEVHSSSKVAPQKRITIRQFRAYVQLTEKGMTPQQAARCAFQHRATDVLTALGVIKTRTR